MADGKGGGKRPAAKAKRGGARTGRGAGGEAGPAERASRATLAGTPAVKAGRERPAGKSTVERPAAPTARSRRIVAAPGKSASAARMTAAGTPAAKGTARSARTPRPSRTAERQAEPVAKPAAAGATKRPKKPSARRKASARALPEAAAPETRRARAAQTSESASDAGSLASGSRRRAARPSREKPRKLRKTRPPSTVPPPGVRVEADELEAVAPFGVSHPSLDWMGQATLGAAPPVFEAPPEDAELVSADPESRRRAVEALEEAAARLAPSAPGLAEDGVRATARDLFSTDTYLRQWGRLAMRNRSEEVDDFGWDPTYDARVAPIFELMYRRWFRVDTAGLEHVPDEGRAMLVANHSGTIPWDGVMLKTAIKLEHRRSELRWLAEDFVFHMPFLGAFMNRIGAVRACQENAERLLRQERLLAVFPEGIQGIGKLFRQRYRLQRFGRGGYVKLALRTGTPILPTAIVGGEETNPMLFKVRRLTAGLGLPYVPVTPTFPLLGPLGLVPAPTRWSIRVGEPIDLEGRGPADAEDAVVINRLNEKVRTAIQSMLDELVARRKSVLFG